MLIFTRNPGESILIGGIEVTVLSGDDGLGEVKIGIDAPGSLEVVRVDGVVHLDAEDLDTPPSLRREA